MRPLLTALIILIPLAASASWNQYRKKPLEWFKTDEARAVAANVLAWQTERGDWPNDTNTFGPFTKNERPKVGTFDDGHTTHETRFLVRMYAATGREEYRDAALKAIDHIFDAQYVTGGFPQRHPPGEKYPRYITFNDRTMVNLLELLRDISEQEEFAFVGEGRRKVAHAMLHAGVRCILALQHQGRFGLTIWAQQYDDVTLEPRPARAFEPAALAAAESADVLVFLMNFENPAPEIVTAVDAGVHWFQNFALRGRRLVRENGDVRVVPDQNAPPIWARYYDFDTMRPLFVGRDGVVKYDLAEIEQERRTGYAWYGNWGEKVLRAYEQWPYRPTGND